MASEFGIKRAFRIFADNGFREPPNAESLMRGWIRRLEKYSDDQVVAAANRYADEDNATWPKAGQLVARYLGSQELRITDRAEYDPQVDPATIPPKWEKRVLWSICGAETRFSIDWNDVPVGELDRHHRWLEGWRWTEHVPMAPWMVERIREHYDLMGIALTPAQEHALDAITDHSMPAEKPETVGMHFM